MALGLAPLICLVAARLKRNRQAGGSGFGSRGGSQQQVASMFWMIGLGVVVLAGLMTFSRGGAGPGGHRGGRGRRCFGPACSVGGSSWPAWGSPG